MDDDVRVWTEPGFELDDAMVVAGVPTLGLVGTIVTHYLHDSLEMDAVGGLRSPHFPPVGKVSEGRLRRPFGMYAMETSCGLDGQCDHLVVVESEFLPFPFVQHAAAEALVAWAREQDVRWIVVPDGLHVPDRETEAVHGVASSAAGVENARKMGFEVIEDGIVGGFSSLLLFEGEEQDVDTLCLLADSSPDHPDARAAARLVQVLDRIIPDVSIEAEPLREEARRIEEAVRETRRRVEERANEMQGPGPDSMMFG